MKCTVSDVAIPEASMDWNSSWGVVGEPGEGMGVTQSGLTVDQSFCTGILENGLEGEESGGEESHG